jgi:hypothetical protein
MIHDDNDKDDDNDKPISIDKLRAKNQNDKLRKMLKDLKNLSPKQKNSAEIIRFNPISGDLDFTQSDLFADVTNEAYFEGYAAAEENLKEQFDAVQKEAEHYRRIVKSISAIVHIEV